VRGLDLKTKARFTSESLSGPPDKLLRLLDRDVRAAIDPDHRHARDESHILEERSFDLDQVEPGEVYE
jgi:hypothetical protein